MVRQVIQQAHVIVCVVVGELYPLPGENVVPGDCYAQCQGEAEDQRQQDGTDN